MNDLRYEPKFLEQWFASISFPSYHQLAFSVGNHQKQWRICFVTAHPRNQFGINSSPNFIHQPLLTRSGIGFGTCQFTLTALSFSIFGNLRMPAYSNHTYFTQPQSTTVRLTYYISRTSQTSCLYMLTTRVPQRCGSHCLLFKF